MINQLKNNEDISLYDNGTPIRDVIHIDDACRAIKTIIDRGKTNEIYNVGSGKPNTIGAIIELSREKLKSTSKINYIESTTFHKVVQNKDFWMDVEKLTSLGFTPQYTVEHIVNDLCQ